uniref:ubiquitin carboxyl-terminal hydrolase MINDY-3-like n=1 Tax=Styela clava TaxID=7725 RepID=UPI0019394104|nr:ubiquitin carboxyl-terminal hydrolase MINDY-3-like [Styela clava]
MEPTDELKKDLLSLVWGENISEAIIKRWSQGFEWSPDERCALTQRHGGPCAVIVPVQAYFVKNLIFNAPENNEDLPEVNNCDWRNLQDEQRKEVFLRTLREMLERSSSSQENKTITLVTFDKDRTTPDEPEHCDSANHEEIEQFSKHSRLRLHTCSSTEDLISSLSSKYGKLTQKYGVLSFLYSVILTRGIENIRNEMDSQDVCLIDSIHGHGSQNLINLMICGEAVSNVWDGIKYISGLQLRGIPCQCDIGFLTLLEKFRYCSVGESLKRPKYPVWIIGSETHLTLLFTLETALVAQESPYEVAMKVFQEYDPEDNGFIAAVLLPDVMTRLDLVAEPEYVKIIQEKLDPEELGVILQSKFLNEFFADDDKKSVPDSFLVLHYNGLTQSSQDSKVLFHEGAAVIIDWQESGNRSSDSVIESCLQMRWPGIQISWKNEIIPSLN